MEKLPVILDREINDPSLDAFGHRHYASALKDLVEGNRPPYSVGLLGTWGVGKTTIKELYLHELKDDVKRNKSVLPITFNAWRYGGENVKRALLRHVYISLGGKEDELKDKMYHQISEVVTKQRSWKEIVSDFYQRYLWYPVQIIFVLLVVIILYIILSKGIDQPLGKTGLGVALSVVFAAVVKFVLSANGMLVPRYSNVTKVYPPTVNAEQYADFLIDQLHNFKKSSVGKQISRIVVFVDDLDRLSSEEMVDGLDAVRIFMEIPEDKLPKDLGIVFVLSCDEDKISYALSNKRNGDYLPGSVSNKKDARRYLDRIFQFRLEILPFPKRDLRSYAKEKLIAAMPDFKIELDAKGTQLSNIVDRLIHPAVQSPRNALQLVNMFMQSWWISKKREFEGSNTNATGGLSEGQVTNHPEALAVICALRVDFHYFFEDLLEDHNLIDAFTKVFINKQEEGIELSERSKRILAKYKKENDDDGTYVLKEEYYSLRQYLRYVQGIRLPGYLQPIILLAQDNVSRKIGNNRLVYDSLINNDSNSILQEFSVNLVQDRLLPVEFMGAVNEIIEDLQNETDLYISNSSIALGELVNKFPKENYYAAIGFLCSSLLHYPEVRWKIGLSNIEEIYFRSSADQKVSLTEILVDEFIKFDEVITFKLRSGQAPTIEELSRMVEYAVGMILRAKFKDVIKFRNEDNFFSWLKTRKYTNGKKEDSLPFSKLESWVVEYSNILQLIGTEYLKEGIEELESGASINNDSYIDSFNYVIEREWPSGQDSKSKVWSLLNKGIQVNSNFLCEYVLSQVVEKANEASEIQKNDFLFALLNRVIQHEENQSDWKLTNYEHYVKLIVDMLSTLTAVTDDLIPSLVKISEYWQKDEGTTNHLVDTIEMIKIKNKVAFEKIMSKMVELLPGDLNPAITEYVGSQYLSLNLEDQQSVVKYFTPLYSSQNADKKMARELSYFLEKVSYEALSSENLKGLVSTLFSRLHSWNNDHNYITTILPALSRIAGSIDLSHNGQAIQTLFTTSNTTNHPDIYNKLSSFMINKMPKQAGELNPYDPTAIFNSAYSVIKRYYSSHDMMNVLYLLDSMVKSEVVHDENDRKVMEVAVLLWEEGYKEETKPLIEGNAYLPNEQEYLQIINSTNLSDAKQRDILISLISELSIHNKKEKFISVSLLLTKELRKDELELWIDLHSGTANLLMEVLNNGELNNEQLKLITFFIIKKLTKEDQQVAKELVLFGIELFEKGREKDGVINITFDLRGSINELFNEDTLIQLQETLLSALIKTSSLSLKRSYASWLADVKAGVIMRNISRFNPSTEDLKILLEVFKNSKSLKKMLQNE